MTQREGLEELARRCEAATGDDAMSRTMRALNADILRATGWREAEGDVIDPAGNLRMQVPFYVGSLDAAMSLVPEGYLVGALNQRTRYEIAQATATSVDPDEQAAWMAWVHANTNDRTFRIGRRFSHHGHAATPALALTAAALRARATLSEGAGKGEGD